MAVYVTFVLQASACGLRRRHLACLCIPGASGTGRAQAAGRGRSSNGVTVARVWQPGRPGARSIFQSFGGRRCSGQLHWEAGQGRGANAARTGGQRNGRKRWVRPIHPSASASKSRGLHSLGPAVAPTEADGAGAAVARHGAVASKRCSPRGSRPAFALPGPCTHLLLIAAFGFSQRVRQVHWWALRFKLRPPHPASRPSVPRRAGKLRAA
jgi:hypothetical protein